MKKSSLDPSSAGVVGNRGLSPAVVRKYEKRLLESFNWRYGNKQDVWSGETALHRAARWVFGHLGAAGGGRILDIGIGTGANLEPLLGVGHQVTGIDIVEPREWADLRRRWNTRIELVKSGFLDWQGPRGQFDLACDFGCLHHQLPELYDRYLEKIAGHLKPQGRLGLCVYKEGDPDARSGRIEVTDHGRLAKCFAADELQALLARNRFEVLSSTEIVRPDLPMNYLVVLGGITDSQKRT